MSDWLDFLRQHGPMPETKALDILPAENTWLMPISGQTLIQLEGPDTHKYLQGQLSCDLNKLDQQHSLIGANCSPKGMVISCFRLFQLAPERVVLRMPEAISTPALANLQKFSVFSKTTLTEVSEHWCGLGLIGSQAAQQLQQAGIEPPQQLGDQFTTPELICIRVAAQQPRFELWASPERAQQLWLTLAENCQVAPASNWQAAEIEAGLAQLNSDSIESYIPQMLNLQAVEAISFDKGCYTGQEVVARLQYRGKLKKLLVSAKMAKTAAPQAGDTIVSPKGRSIGKVLSQVEFADHWLIQLVISKAGFDEGLCQLETTDGAQLELQPLPYPLEPELFERPEPKL